MVDLFAKLVTCHLCHFMILNVNYVCRIQSLQNYPVSKNEQIQAIIKKLIMPIIDTRITRDIAVHAKVGKGEVRQVQEDPVWDSRPWHLWHLWPHLELGKIWSAGWTEGKGPVLTAYNVLGDPEAKTVSLSSVCYKVLSICKATHMESGNALRSLWSQALSTKSLSKNRSRNFSACSDVSKDHFSLSLRQRLSIYLDSRKRVGSQDLNYSQLLTPAQVCTRAATLVGRVRPWSTDIKCMILRVMILKSYVSSRFKDHLSFRQVSANVFAPKLPNCLWRGWEPSEALWNWAVHARTGTRLEWFECLKYLHTCAVWFCDHAVSRCIWQHLTTIFDVVDHDQMISILCQVGSGVYRTKNEGKDLAKISEVQRCWSSCCSLPPEPGAQACPHWHIGVLMDVDGCWSCKFIFTYLYSIQRIQPTRSNGMCPIFSQASWTEENQVSEIRTSYSCLIEPSHTPTVTAAMTTDDTNTYKYARQT